MYRGIFIINSAEVKCAGDAFVITYLLIRVEEKKAES